MASKAAHQVSDRRSSEELEAAVEVEAAIQVVAALEAVLLVGQGMLVKEWRCGSGGTGGRSGGTGGRTGEGRKSKYLG